MIEAVENHMPQVIVIDEIGTEQEAFAARTIAERGVQLVGPRTATVWRTCC
jgi:stage III sporulation protein SpoIIIAA